MRAKIFFYNVPYNSTNIFVVFYQKRKVESKYIKYVLISGGYNEQTKI